MPASGSTATRLAQSASERIVRTLAPAEEVIRLGSGDVGAVLDRVRARGEGIYLVGLDYHVGFLVHRGERMELCHASYLPPVKVVCEPAAEAGAFVSSVHVFAPLLSDATVERWLRGSRFAVGR